MYLILWQAARTRHPIVQFCVAAMVLAGQCNKRCYSLGADGNGWGGCGHAGTALGRMLLLLLPVAHDTSTDISNMG